METRVTTFGAIGTILLLLAAILVARKLRVAFLLTVAGEVFWLYEAVELERYDLAVMCVAFGVIAFYSWVLWGKK